MPETTEILVVGAGVIGLAVGRALAQQGRETVVIERHARVGEETSSRNSGVIHSGIYYQNGSRKAELCIRGRHLLYEYCKSYGIGHCQTGKIIVAQRTQVDALHALRKRGEANGVSDLEFLSASEVNRLEPLVHCEAGLLSPSTGIINVHEFLMGLWADLEHAGGTLAFHCELLDARIEDPRIHVRVRTGTTETELICRWVINCAGLHAPALLGQVHGYPSERRRLGYLAKGNYFQLRGRRPFRHLIYPMPSEAGLGIHLTLDMDGSIRFGPDVEWTDKLDYDVDSSRVELFYEAIRSYWPTIPPDSLIPAYAGIRPKIVGPNEASADFLIEDSSTHGVAGLINLLGIESPGLTSSLAIAEAVCEIITDRD